MANGNNLSLGAANYLQQEEGDDSRSTSFRDVENNPQAHLSEEASLENPTSQYLHEHFTKAQLQKHCRQLGINGIWVTKDELIHLIIAHSSRNGSPNVSGQPVPLQKDQECVSHRLEKFIMETNSKFANMNVNLQLKDREIESLKLSLKVAEDQIQSLMLKQQKYEDGVLNSKNATGDTSAAKSLLLGDSTLREVKTSDLGVHSIVRTVPEANLDLLKAWVTEKLDFPVKECIVYGGLNDLIERECNVDQILDDLGALVAEIKAKNENVNVSICELVPTLNEHQEKIANYNLKLTEWCAKNGLSFISTELFFRLGTGDIDMNCFNSFNSDDKSVNFDLTRIGATRLLDAISKRIPNLICNNWTKVKCHKFSSYKNKQVNGYERYDNLNFQTNEYRKTDFYYSGRGDNRQYQPRRDITRKPSYYHPREPSPHPPLQRYHPNPINSTNSYTASTRSNINVNDSYPQKKNGCFNCGEFNHHHTICRFDHKLKCGNCNKLGHKSKLCDHYSR